MTINQNSSDRVVHIREYTSHTREGRIALGKLLHHAAIASYTN